MGGRPAEDAGTGDRSMNSKLWKKLRILLAKVLVVTFLINTTVYGGGTGSLAGLKLGRHDTATESNASRPAVDTASPSMPGFDADVDYGDFDDSGYDTDWDPAGTPSEAEPATPSNAVYRDGVIRIYNQRQLEAIGTGVPVTDSDRSYSDFGLGELMYLENEPVCYSQDAVYEVMRDIELPEYLWNIPEDFSGSFVSSQEQTSDVLYKRGSDTIYIYNPLQLAVLNQEDSDLEPVLTGDYSVSRFGTGNLIYPYPNASPSETNDYITYAKDHSYVLKAGFTTEYETATPSVALLDMEDISLDGRDYPGQTVAEIGGEEYILIGNKTQFDAIGTDVPVNEGLFVRTRFPAGSGEFDEWLFFYEGDADFSEENKSKFGELYEDCYNAYDGHNYQYCGLKYDEEGNIIPDDDNVINGGPGNGWKGNAGVTGLTYSRDAKYIIFRNIDFEGVDREPLYFTGTMLGAKEDTLEAVLDASDFDSIKDILKDAPQSDFPVFSNISINKTGKVSPDEGSYDVGVGFFNLQATSDGLSFDQVKSEIYVSNLILDTLQIKNASTEINEDNIDSLVDALVTALGDILSGVLEIVGGLSDSLLKWLLDLLGLGDIFDNLNEFVENLFDLSATDASVFSTGAFAGIIQGNVTVRNCHVKNLDTVLSRNGLTGGFAGSIKGVPLYDLSGEIVHLLKAILNAIPFLGLGDLITLLLGGGLIDLKNLFPRGYINARVDGCSVSYAQEAEIKSNGGYVGGFAGYIQGAFINDCALKTDSDVSEKNTLTIAGPERIGGFAGTVDIGVIQGTLDELGLELVNTSTLFRTSSLVTNCHVGDEHSIIELIPFGSNKDGYKLFGGFSGAVYSSYIAQCTVKGIADIGSIEAPVQYVGGFAGQISRSNITEAGAEAETGGMTLIEFLKQTLTGLLGDGLAENNEKASALLSLAGVKPSALIGCSVSGEVENGFSIYGKDHAGGFTGSLEGSKILSSEKFEAFENDDDRQHKSLFNDWNNTKGKAAEKYNIEYDFPAEDLKNNLTNFVSVKGTDFVGGIVGEGTIESAADIISSAIKTADYMTPEIAGVHVYAFNKSDGYSVTASGNYAGGAFGKATGGKSDSVSLNDLASIKANNYAGGFAGQFGTGSIANVGGISLLGELVKINGLLSFGATIESYAKNTDINGISQGYTVIATQESNTEATDGIKAGGFVGETVSGTFESCEIKNLRSVAALLDKNGDVDTDGYAGGFSGIAKPGALVETTDDTGILPEGINISELLTVAPYLQVKCDNCNVAFITEGEVTGDYAGGFIGYGEAVAVNAGELSTPEEEEDSDAADTTDSSQEENPEDKPDPKPVYDSAGTGKTVISGLKQVTGTKYAGGFAGELTAGALTQTGTLDLLGILNLTDLLSVMNVGYSRVENTTVTGVSARADGVIESGSEKQTDHGMAGGFFGSATAVIAKNDRVDQAGEIYGLLRAGGFAGEMKAGTAAAVDGFNDSLVNQIVNIDSLVNVLELGYCVFEDCRVRGTNLTLNEDGKTTDGGLVVRAGTEEGDMATSVASTAGGFVGLMESGSLKNKPGQAEGSNETGTADQSEVPEVTDSWKNESLKGVAVENLAAVEARAYAGGFGGLAKAGATVDLAEGNPSLLGKLLNLNNALSLLNVFVPVVEGASVLSAHLEDGTHAGFTVKIIENPNETDFLQDLLDSHAGSAGGFIGYGSGVQIKNSDVYQLKSTTVSYPKTADIKDLEREDGSSYFDDELSEYAITAPRYAGGYAGCLEAGSAAAVGGVSLLESILSLVLDTTVLSCIVSTVDNSDVWGAPGGFNVRASLDETGTKSLFAAFLSDGTEDLPSGKAGGYVGELKGSHIAASDVYNFEYIISQLYAGGYVGDMLPCSAAEVLGGEDAGKSFLNHILNLDNGGLLNVAEAFVPSIKNSSAYGVPCGAVVRADYASSEETRDAVGAAGGYVGHNNSGQIWGQANDGNAENADENQDCEIVRLRSVYGGNYAGGYTGLMENGALAEAGGLEILGGLISIDNLLSVGGTIYATQKHTGITGPLRNLSVEEWNKWVKAIGEHSTNYQENPPTLVQSEDQLEAMIERYAYGFRVATARTGDTPNTMGTGGGYVGKMVGGIIEDAHAMDLLDVYARAAAGGFAGSMEPGSAAELGSIGILGGDVLDLNAIAGVATIFVPKIERGSIAGAKSGAEILATGKKDANAYSGMAGGYVGACYSGQIWGTVSTDADGADPEYQYCETTNLRSVTGSSYVGGFAGLMEIGSVLDVNGLNGGLLGGILGLITTPLQLASVLDLVAPVVRLAGVRTVDDNQDKNLANDYGFTVGGEDIIAAGGFAGKMEGTILGRVPEVDPVKIEAETDDKKLSDSQVEALYQNNVFAEGLRSVAADYYAGGFVGYADTASAVSVEDDSGNETNILKDLLAGLTGGLWDGSLASVGNLTALDTLRTYIYNAKLKGIDQGAAIESTDFTDSAVLQQTIGIGSAGGFSGALLNSSVNDSVAENIGSVKARYYAGGFSGYTGKSGLADVEGVKALEELLSLGAGVLSLFGSDISDSKVIGSSDGLRVQCFGPDSAVGDSDVTNLIPEAGGFVGFTDLGKIRRSSVENLGSVYSVGDAGGFAGRTTMEYAVNVETNSVLLTSVVVPLLEKILDTIHIDDLEDLGALKLKITGWLDEFLPENTGFDVSKLLNIYLLSDGNLLGIDLLGLSITVRLSADENPAEITIGDSSVVINGDGTVSVDLIKGNRTSITDCVASGIPAGYDVYGAGADASKDGDGQFGTGGFVGRNTEGYIARNEMIYADTVKGSPEAFTQTDSVHPLLVENEKNVTNPFVGITTLATTYNFNISYIEENNTYRIYRQTQEQSITLPEYDGTDKAISAEDRPGVGDGFTAYPLTYFVTDDQAAYDLSTLEGAAYDNSSSPVAAYVSAGEADLMDGASRDLGEGQTLLTLEKQVVEQSGNSRAAENVPDGETFFITVKDSAGKVLRTVQMKDDSVVKIPVSASGNYTITERTPTGYAMKGYQTGGGADGGLAEGNQPSNTNGVYQFQVTVGTEGAYVLITNQRTAEGGGGSIGTPDVINHIPIGKPEEEKPPEVLDPCA